MNWFRLFVLLCLLFSVRTSWAKRKALLVGNVNYRVKAAGLVNPVYDILKIAESLRAAGFSTRVVRNANEPRLRKELNRFARRLTARDEALVYYSGHGFAIDGVNFLMGVDFDAHNPVDALARNSDIYSVNRLVKRLEVTKARRRIIIIDANRREPFTQAPGWETKDFNPDKYVGYEDISQIPTAQGTFVAFSTGTHQYAFDTFKNELAGSPYGYALSTLLIIKPGIDISELFDEVSTLVRQLTDNQQTPQHISNLTDSFHFQTDKPRSQKSSPRHQPPKRSPASKRTKLARKAPVTTPAPGELRPIIVPSDPSRSASPAPRTDIILAPLPPPRKVIREVVSIPEGEVYLGCMQGDKFCREDEKKRAKIVFLEEYGIDRTEVTVEDYEKCVKAGQCSDKDLDRTHFGRRLDCNWLSRDLRRFHPINCVNWKQAEAYCKWKGQRLPTNEEWEKAARGPFSHIYPWGNEAPSCRFAVMKSRASGCSRESTWPVGSKRDGDSPYGLHDMAGNVAEWTSSRKYRGGSWQDGPQDLRLSAHRWVVGFGFYRHPSLGFRCVTPSH